jgi:hypothetical protein
MNYRLERADGLIDRTHWWKDLNTREKCNLWWLTGEGLLTGTLAGRRWRESRPATEAEVEFWSEIKRLENSHACGAHFEHTSQTCELATGHSGNHLVRIEGGHLDRPYLERE